jgi:hypothetical protein
MLLLGVSFAERKHIMTDNVISIGDIKAKHLTPNMTPKLANLSKDVVEVKPTTTPVYQVKGMAYDLLSKIANVALVCEENSKIACISIVFPIDAQMGDTSAEDQIKIKLIDLLNGVTKFLEADISKK